MIGAGGTVLPDRYNAHTVDPGIRRIPANTRYLPTICFMYTRLYQFIRIFFPECIEFRVYDEAAVGLGDIFPVIIHMIAFCRIKYRERFDFGYCIWIFRQDLYGNFFLFISGIEYDRTVLCANVIPLAVESGWIVKMKKYFHNILKGYDTEILLMVN